jgi:chorismate dehydratase
MSTPDPATDAALQTSPGPGLAATAGSPPGVRLGCPSFLNTLPMIEGLGKLEGMRLTLTVPSRLIDLLTDRSIDMGLISSIDALRSPEPVALVPVGMIGCKGLTMTVRLYSRVPIEQITQVHADIDSHTSIALMRIILAERYGLRPELHDFDVDAHRSALAAAQDGAGQPNWPEAVLLIGDKVIADSPPAGLYPYQLDLGLAWLELTGLPFVYAIWMARPDEVDSPLIRRAIAVLDRQRRHNQTRLDWIVTQRAPVRRWPGQVAQEYLRTRLCFEVTEDARAGLELFFAKAIALGIAPGKNPVLWSDRMARV